MKQSVRGSSANTPRIRRILTRHIEGRLPPGSTITSLVARDHSRYHFKRALRLHVTYTLQRTKHVIIVHVNIPSKDTTREIHVADAIERALEGSGGFTGTLIAPRSFGILPVLRANAYADIPGTSLDALLHTNPPKAMQVAGGTARWLQALARLNLKVGTLRSASRIQLESTFFLNNFNDANADTRESAALVLHAAVTSQQKIIKKYKRYFRTIHGDLNLGNIIADSRHIGMIDFGNSVVYDPYSDAGNFLAQVDVLVWRKNISTQLGKKLHAAFERQPGRATGLGPDRQQRIDIHRAWWILQICAYTCATERSIGRRILPIALAQATELLTRAGYAPPRPLLAASKASLPTALCDVPVMLSFFRSRLISFFPKIRSLEHVAIHHQPALSTTSFLMRYRLDVTTSSGTRAERIVRGNFVRPDTAHFLQRVYTHACGFSTMQPLMFDASLGYLFYEELAGTPLRNLPLGSPSYHTLIRKIGSALAAFHNIPPGSLPRMPWSIEQRFLTAAVRNIERCGQNCLPEVRIIAQRIAKRERALWRQQTALVHNDFQASNIIITPYDIGLIDFTMSGVAHPAIDVANFLTHLEVMFHAKRSSRAIAAFRQTFLVAYQAGRRTARDASFERALKVFEIRSALDILAITVINLGSDDPHRCQYVTLLVKKIRILALQLA